MATLGALRFVIPHLNSYVFICADKKKEKIAGGGGGCVERKKNLSS